MGILNLLCLVDVFVLFRLNDIPVGVAKRMHYNQSTCTFLAFKYARTHAHAHAAGSHARMYNFGLTV